GSSSTPFTLSPPLNPRPRGPRPPLPWPKGPPGPPKLGRGRAAFRPSRRFSSFNEPVFSASHSANHFANVSLSSVRVSEPSLLASTAAKKPGPRNGSPNPPRPPPNRCPSSGGAPPDGPNPWGRVGRASCRERV